MAALSRPQHLFRCLRPRRVMWIVAGLLVTLAWGGDQHVIAGQRQPLPVTRLDDEGPNPNASFPDTRMLYELVSGGQGEAALLILAQTAEQAGGWRPAPGDRVVYDPEVVRPVRAASRTVDEPPGECASPRLSRLTEECQVDFQKGENLVRFGRLTFANLGREGTRMVPRPVFDDVLSTYIEEVSHSWQEYLYETEGRGSGARTRATLYEDELYWSAGWEYQAKRYLISLDGEWLALSVAERAALFDAICAPDGYAAPLGHPVPPYGPPPGWPNPGGWPSTAPSEAELQRFCAAR